MDSRGAKSSRATLCGACLWVTVLERHGSLGTQDVDQEVEDYQQKSSVTGNLSLSISVIVRAVRFHLRIGEGQPPMKPLQGYETSGQGEVIWEWEGNGTGAALFFDFHLNLDGWDNRTRLENTYCGRAKFADEPCGSTLSPITTYEIRIRSDELESALAKMRSLSLRMLHLSGARPAAKTVDTSWQESNIVEAGLAFSTSLWHRVHAAAEEAAATVSDSSCFCSGFKRCSAGASIIPPNGGDNNGGGAGGREREERTAA
ncbi:hypothetical protein CORC01_02914 [Colletotrichum orchidophilum]|uniref:Uncharacterized protein n=1 Tax=Colletotrichum orchidophilum TaxID=1209926 RepID=A0A1G4BK86_9PEZI|nr:uncharacterized protein CORC01_02914 [Colletotrichum orchidophilum]OHF01723.1 hypothetical protein CORC01_02914 [Colletotrichum orchidophilum]